MPKIWVEKIENGTMCVHFHLDGIFAIGYGDTTQEAYHAAWRDWRCKVHWGPLHNLMDSDAHGCFDEWRKEIARLTALAFGLPASLIGG